MRSTKNTGRHPFSIGIVGAILLMVVCAAISSSGQTIFGRISGAIRDKQGAGIPNAAVTLTNSATNLTRTVTTDENGFYTATNLPVGAYNILVESKGFNEELGSYVAYCEYREHQRRLEQEALAAQGAGGDFGPDQQAQAQGGAGTTTGSTTTSTRSSSPCVSWNASGPENRR